MQLPTGVLAAALLMLGSGTTADILIGAGGPWTAPVSSLMQEKDPAGNGSPQKKQEKQQDDDPGKKNGDTKNGEADQADDSDRSDDSDSQADDTRSKESSNDSQSESEPRDTTPTPIDWSVEGVKDLNFDHLKFDIQPDEAFQIRQLTAQLIKLRGHRIRIRGYIKPAFKPNNITKFVLVRDNQECCFGPGAALYDCMIVSLKPGNATDFSTRPITVEGTFQLKPFRGEDKKIWAIFQLKDAQVR